jgi:hypothetical protein
METIVVKKGIINVAEAAGANVKVDAADGAFPGQTIVCLDAAVTPPVEIISPIPKGVPVKGIKMNAQAEVRQHTLIGRAQETIVASTRYRIELWNGKEHEGERQSPFRFAFTSAAVLSGNAATDRVNVYTALQNKINAYGGAYATAYIVSSVAYTLGKTAVPVVGETVTQETSGATAIIAAVVQATNDIDGADSTGVIYLCNLSGTWSAAAKTLTGGTSTAVMTTNAVLTAGEGLLIIDDAGYYGPRPNGQRKLSEIQVTQGFTTAIVEGLASTITTLTADGVATGLPGLYSFGIGTRMLQDVPTFFPGGYGLVDGEAEAQYNVAPLAGTTYRCFIIETDYNASDTNMRNAAMNTPYWWILYVNIDAGSTKVDAFETALEAGLGITFS